LVEYGFGAFPLQIEPVSDWSAPTAKKNIIQKQIITGFNLVFPTLLTRARSRNSNVPTHQGAFCA
jgi:hypothetical protein